WAAAWCAALSVLPVAGPAQQAEKPVPGAAGRTGAPGPEASPNDIDGQQMFATLCGFCHENGGRKSGKAPKLAGSKRSDEYMINSFQYRRADCDVVLNAITDKAALAEVGLRMSRPYYRTGVVLAVREESAVNSLAHLGPARVGVQVGSLASMALSKRGVATTPF